MRLLIPVAIAAAAALSGKGQRAPKLDIIGRADALISVNESLPEAVDADDFDALAAVLAPLGSELGRGDYSLVLDVGRGDVLKILTDARESRLLRALQATPTASLPHVEAIQRSRYLAVHLAVISKYTALPRAWQNAIRQGVQFDTRRADRVAEAFNLTPQAVHSFQAAIAVIASHGFQLTDWTPDNVMWDKQRKVPVLTDLGGHRRIGTRRLAPTP